MPTISSLEIFSGAGGLATGMALNHVKHQALVEWNKDACQTLRENFDPNIVHHVDIREFEFTPYDRVDIVAGGPPCQPFSLGGKHQGSIDHRDMFPYACKAISQCKPLAFIFENVKGLLRQAFSAYFQYIILRLTYPDIEIKHAETWDEHFIRLEKVHSSPSYNGTRYRVLFRLIDAADYGIPQRRERVIIVGIREDLGSEWSFPPQTHSFDALIWSQFISQEYWDKHNISPTDIRCYDERMRAFITKMQEQSWMFPPDTKPWRTIRDQLKDIPPPDEHGTFHPEHIFRDGARSYPGHTGSFIDLPSKTIKAGDHGVPGGENMVRYDNNFVRYFTTYEAKLLQTFPPNYTIHGSWTESMRQIGNAVPVELARILSDSIIQQIMKNTDTHIST